MSKIIQVNKSSIQRYFPNKKIFDNIIHFLKGNFNGSSLIAGGAARYILSINKHPSPADDIDIYLLDTYIDNKIIEEEFIRGVFKGYKKEEYFHCLEPINIKGSSNLLYGIYTLVCRPYFPNIQFICTNYESPSLFSNEEDIFSSFKTNIENLTDETILNSFDFTVCQSAIFPYSQNDLICKVSENFIQDEKHRRLNLTGTYSDTLINRIYKYIKLGYRLTEESYIYILNHLENTKDKNEQEQGHNLLRKKRNNGDFIIAPYAEQLYEKWISSMR